MDVKVDNMVEEVTLGFGSIDLVDKELKELLETEGPHLETQVYNVRKATLESIRKLWVKVGLGESLHAICVENAVIVAVEGEDSMAGEWTKKWDHALVWSEKGKKGVVVLVNGNHRLQLVKLFLLEKGLKELEECLRRGLAEKAEKVRKELRLLVKWTARVVDQGKA